MVWWWVILAAEQLEHELVEIGFDPEQVNLRDERYFCPRLKWLVMFARFCSTNCPPYQAGKFDCDDLALWAIQQATNASRLNPTIKDGHALGYEEILIYQGRITRHANNLCRCQEGWFRLDPQNGDVQPTRMARETVIPIWCFV